MKTKLFAFIVLMLLPLGMAAQSDPVEAELEAQYDFVLRRGEGTSTDPFYFEVRRDEKVGACDIYGNEFIAPRYNYLFLSRVKESIEDKHYFFGSLGDDSRGTIYHFLDVFGTRLNIPDVTFNVRYDVENGFEYKNSEYGIWRKTGIKLPITSSPWAGIKPELEPNTPATGDTTLSAILGKSLLTERDKALLDEGYSSQSTHMKIMDLNQQSNIYDGEDDARAFRFMHEAARLGDCWSLYQIGLKYCLGDGTTMDMAKGKKCLQKAASMGGYGSEDAQKVLEGLE
ncbi:MAG: sel1 repeat family protein [Alloprevotella sp.]|nr:sel1 repeat family protein [Alloprevotella sp.]